MWRGPRPYVSGAITRRAGPPGRRHLLPR